MMSKIELGLVVVCFIVIYLKMGVILPRRKLEHSETYRQWNKELQIKLVGWLLDAAVWI